MFVDGDVYIAGNITLAEGPPASSRCPTADRPLIPSRRRHPPRRPLRPQPHVNGTRGTIYTCSRNDSGTYRPTASAATRLDVFAQPATGRQRQRRRQPHQVATYPPGLRDGVRRDAELRTGAGTNAAGPTTPRRCGSPPARCATPARLTAPPATAAATPSRFRRCTDHLAGCSVAGLPDMSAWRHMAAWCVTPTAQSMRR